jgi:D-alanine-D-alanine ligase
MKITVLTYVEREESRSHDAVVGQVKSALKQQGHQVSVLGVHGDLRKLVAGLLRRRPDVVFNVMEMFGSNMFGDIGVAGALELLNLCYTGGGPGEFYLQQDKALTKKLLAFDRIAYPDFAVFSRNADFETGGNLRMPLFVKPLRGDASIGIDGHSLVHNAVELMKRVALIHEQVHDSALAEEYVEGREFYVGILGNEDPAALPPIEIDFSGFPEGLPHVVDGKAKWARGSAEYNGTRAVIAEVGAELRARLQKIARGAYRALRVRDYGRIDLRLNDSGDIYVIEVNGNCYLERSGEFAVAAAAAGIDYPTLLNRIVELACRRCHRAGPRRRRSRRAALDQGT